ncbi:MAG: hypothetical protein PHO90_00795, partial [Candidatus Pacebacteria bacterium]|nr:hypothetical protein [Candidatus Paceibacterota bacterium]
IYKKHCRPKIIQPTFVIHHPYGFQPLAKNIDQEKLASFQVVVAGAEIVNAFSELNDPLEQEKRFKEQEKMFKGGFEEAQRSDEEFVEALEYGMPPAAGFGLGIDRLVSIITDSDSLREVILFPLMKPFPIIFCEGQIAELLEVRLFNATSEEQKITTIGLKRLGVSSDATLSNTCLFDGIKRLTGEEIFSSGKITFNNPNGIIVIPPKSSKVINVKSVISYGTMGQTVGVSLERITPNSCESLLEISLPVNGKIYGIAAAPSLARVTVGTPLPILTAPVVPAPTDSISDVRIWESDITIINGSVVFSRMSLRQTPSDVTNFKLTIGGTEVATVASLDANGYINFTFDKTIQTGTINVRVSADITRGYDKIIKPFLESVFDVEIKDVKYGVDIPIIGVPAVTGGIISLSKRPKE